MQRGIQGPTMLPTLSRSLQGFSIVCRPLEQAWRNTVRGLEDRNVWFCAVERVVAPFATRLCGPLTTHILDFAAWRGDCVVSSRRR